MKTGIVAASWIAIAIGAFSNVHAQQSVVALAGDPRQSGVRTTSSSASDHQLPGDELASVTSSLAEIAPAVAFPEPITGSQCGSCGQEYCCGTEQCCGSGCGSSFHGCRVKFVPYLWLTEMHGNATLRGVTQNVHISTRDLLDLIEHNVHFLFSGKLEVEQECGPLGVIVNGFYIKAGLANEIERFNMSQKFDHAIIDVAFTYEVEALTNSLPQNSKVDLLAGGRYWLLDAGGTITGPLGNSVSFGGKKDWVDPFIGGRIIMPLNCYSNLQVRGDLGGFDWGTASDYTWNVEALVEMTCSECCSLRGGYRVLDVDQQRGSGNQAFGYDMQYRGPVVEIVLSF